MKFSQRIGITQAKKILQTDSIDDELRNSLWNLLTAFYWEKFNKKKFNYASRYDHINGSNLGRLFKALWLHYFKKPTDTMPELFFGDQNGLGKLRSYYFDAQWYEVYDFIEFVPAHAIADTKDKFMEACNHYLERENSAYRFLDGRIVEISSPEEINEIEEAMEKSTPYYGVKQHLSDAISMLSDRENPNYRNSIKESISAVESLCKTVSGNDKATLGEALKILEKNGKLHPALKSAFSALYGYTNDADGIRHALIEKNNLTSADARFMLVSCSAFVNYIIASIINDV